jgi:glutamine cyclotransferase
MSLSDLFARFGAPLANTRWSWGSMRPDGTIFLRVWTDEMKTIDGRRYVRLINHRAYRGEGDNLGYQERCEHVQMLTNGAAGYAVLCRAAEPRAKSREIVSFDAQTVFRLGQLAVFDGDDWAEVVERVPVRSIA